MIESSPALVSIVIPAFKTTWFEETLLSAIAQDYPCCEIIVSDDSPSGEIGQIVNKLKSQSPHRLTYYRNEPALGDVGNYEQCFRLSQGKYVKLLSDDDLLAPNCVSRLVAAIEAAPDIRLATSRRRRISATGKPQTDIFANASPVSQDSVIIGSDIFAFQSKEPINFIGEPCCVLMFREDIISLMQEEDGLFSIGGEIMHFLEDLTFYTKVLKKGNLVYLTDVLSFFRLSRNQKSEEGRANDPRAVNSHIKYREYAESLARASGLETRTQVRVAPLHKPNEFVWSNITLELDASLKESKFYEWLNVRKVSEQERHIINAYVHENALVTSLVVVIDALHADWELVEKTLQSLDVEIANSLHIRTVILSSEQHTNHDCVVIKDKNITNAVIADLSARNEDWCMFVEAGDEFICSGLNALSTTLARAGELYAVYADEIYAIDGKKIGARFRPDFNLDLLISHPASMAQHWVWRRELIVTPGLIQNKDTKFLELEVILKIIELEGITKFGHLAEPLVSTHADVYRYHEAKEIIHEHLRLRGYENGHVELAEHSVFQVSYHHDMNPLVSIVLLGYEDMAVIMASVLTLIEKTTWYNYELILVVPQKQTAETQAWLDSVQEVDASRIKIVYFQGERHYAMLANQGASVAKGDYLLLLDSSLAIINKDWLHRLLNHGLRPEVGIVGGKQLYADGTIRHAGYILGMKGVASDAFYASNDQWSGHMSRLHADQNYSAVSGDFMLVKRHIFTDIGGIDESLTLLPDVDFCLRSAQNGWLTVWTPYAKMLRTVLKKSELLPVEKQRHEKKLEDNEVQFYRTWRGILANDPAYNANLSLSSENFNVCPDSLLSWQPLDWHPLPSVVPHMADFYGCGYYRIIKPFEAMKKYGLVDGKLSETMLSVPYLERYKPDSVIFQRQLTPEFHEWASYIKKVSGVFKVFELDDLLTNLPLKNIHKSEFGSDVIKMLRKSLSFVDRFVVSTEPLAEAYKHFHSDIVVRQNCLSEDWWGNLTSLRHQGRKPRVGWAGGSSHRGDLEMIIDVVKSFHHEVEWVFFGMCPDQIRPWISEFHSGVDIEIYPQKLASLNLDLALAPVEDNNFNVCKSNLRLLEYGACAIPVICSDVECYRGTLPATRVRNRYKDWHDAIRMHLDDSAYSEAMGIALHNAVMKDFVLNEERAKEWSKVWLPN
ncbi:glycosyltransferase [Pantoea allii]|uniref:glycosyltransferase n=1 Tax=Pantoea allii TaxID=574096 RepID=UPI0024B6396C|nr:glycosyltransferase [Pantoea allii]MDJ0038120.1 glycosyltransferase [Pantoea allii]